MPKLKLWLLPALTVAALLVLAAPAFAGHDRAQHAVRHTGYSGPCAKFYSSTGDTTNPVVVNFTVYTVPCTVTLWSYQSHPDGSHTAVQYSTGSYTITGSRSLSMPVECGYRTQVDLVLGTGPAPGTPDTDLQALSVLVRCQSPPPPATPPGPPATPPSGPPSSPPPATPSGPPSVDVTVVKTADKSVYGLGDNATYKFDAWNDIADYATATDVVLHDPLPAGFLADPATLSNPQQCHVSGHAGSQVLGCDLGALQSVWSGGKHIIITLGGKMTRSGQINNTACVQPSDTSGQPDSNEGNNCSTSTVTVNVPPKVSTPPSGGVAPPVKHTIHHKPHKHHRQPPRHVHYTP